MTQIITLENIITVISIFSFGLVAGLSLGQIFNRLRRDYPPVIERGPYSGGSTDPADTDALYALCMEYEKCLDRLMAASKNAEGSAPENGEYERR